MTYRTAIVDVEDPEGIVDLSGISRTMLRDQTYASLKRAILTGKIAQGEKLTIRKLAAISDFSSTPIREALLKLEHDGIVIRASSGQFFVRQFSRKEIERIFQLRILLETYGIAEAMENITEQDIIELEENLKRSEAALAKGCLSEVSELSTEFHNYLSSVSKDEILQELLQGISDKISISRSTAIYATGKAYNAIIQHRRIIECIRSRNLRALKQALKEHIVMAKQIALEEIVKATERISSKRA
jgi:DNA-binding GntR family transcriptional regulator